MGSLATVYRDVGVPFRPHGPEEDDLAMRCCRPLVASPWLRDIPPVVMSESVVLTPASYSSWTTCYTMNPTKRNFLLTPGDYVSWGPLTVSSGSFGSGSFRSFRYYNPADDRVHPVRRANQARVDGFIFTGAGASWFILQGLQVRNPSVDNTVSTRVHDVIIDRCLIERCEVYGIRMLSCYDSCVQNTVIRDAVQLGADGTGDSSGVQFKNIAAVDDVSCVRNRVIDCEIFNCGDAIQFTESTTTWQEVTAVVDGNDLYNHPNQFLPNGKFKRENAVDMKAGGFTPGSTLITNNRIWGFRQNVIPTALGEAVVIQRYCRNGIFSGNIVGDCPRGLKDENWPATLNSFTVDPTTDLLTDPGHNMVTGAGPLRIVRTGSVPGGLSTGSDYYAIVVDSSSFRLATSYVNSLSGTYVDVTSAGSSSMWQIRVGASRNWTVNDNEWYDIRDIASDDSGSVWLSITDILFTNNWVARSRWLHASSPSVYWGPTFSGNHVDDRTNVQRPELRSPPVPWSASLNRTFTQNGRWKLYERKRWTGPEWACGARPADP